MAWALVMCEFSRSRGDSSDLRRIEQASSRSGIPPVLQTTESCELHAQEQGPSDNKQLAGLSIYHRDSLDLITVRLMSSFKKRLILAYLWACDKTEGITQGHRVADYVFKNMLRPRRGQ